MQRVYDFLKGAGTYYLATDDHGQPRVRPFGTIDLYEGQLTIQTGRKKDCYRQMKENPRVEICAFKNGEWIRVQAEARECEDIAAERHMLDAYPELRAMYQPGDGNTVVLALTNGHAVISSFTAAPIEIKL